MANMTYYCTVHRDEDQQKLLGQKLDSCNVHMVFDTGYDLASMQSVVQYHSWKVIWEMEKDDCKFGYRFSRLVGIPHGEQV